MTIKLTSTAESAEFIKCLVYSESGFGKTWLCQTAPKPVIISIEKGLLTLKDVKPKIPVIEIKNFEDLEAAYEFVTTDPRAEHLQTVCLDSITDIAETVLSAEKEKSKDARNAYGNYVDKLLPLIKKFRDIEGKHVYFTCKMKRTTDDDNGKTSYGPSMPGQQLGPNMPYIFDFCLALRIGMDDEGKKFRYLQTDSDLQYIAKARGDALNETERANLGYIFDKALGKLDPEEIEETTDKKEETKEVEENNEVETEGSFEDEEIDQAASDEEDAANQASAEGKLTEGASESLDQASEDSLTK